MPEGFASVRELMSERVVSVAPEDTVGEAMSLMRKHEVSELPVLSNGHIKGWVAYEQILQRGGLPNQAKVSTVMISPPQVRPETDPLAAAEHMIRTQSRALPVVDQRGTIVGVLSRTDLLRVAPTIPDVAAQTLEKVMTQELETVTEDEETAAVEHRLMALHIRQLLVVDRHGKLVGAIGAKELATARHGESPKEVSGHHGGHFPGPGRRKDRALHVGSLARRTRSLTPEATLEQAVEVMLKDHTNFVAVVDGEGMPVGIVSRADVLQRLAAFRARDQGDVMVQLSGLGDALDTSDYDGIYRRAQSMLKKAADEVRIEFLGLHYKIYKAKREGDVKYALTARLSTDKELLVGKADGWDLAAATDEALDILERRVRNLKEMRLERRKGGPRRAASFYQSS